MPRDWTQGMAELRPLQEWQSVVRDTNPTAEALYALRESQDLPNSFISMRVAEHIRQAQSRAFRAAASMRYTTVGGDTVIRDFDGNVFRQSSMKPVEMSKRSGGLKPVMAPVLVDEGVPFLTIADIEGLRKELLSADWLRFLVGPILRDHALLALRRHYRPVCCLVTVDRSGNYWINGKLSNPFNAKQYADIQSQSVQQVLLALERRSNPDLFKELRHLLSRLWDWKYRPEYAHQPPTDLLDKP